MSIKIVVDATNNAKDLTIERTSDGLVKLTARFSSGETSSANLTPAEAENIAKLSIGTPYGIPSEHFRAGHFLFSDIGDTYYLYFKPVGGATMISVSATDLQKAIKMLSE